MATVQRHPRFSANLPVALFDSERATFEELKVENISVGGIFVRTERPLPPDSMVLLRLKLDDVTMGASARVVHVIDASVASAQQLSPGMGLSFGLLGAKERVALECFVAKLARAATETYDAGRAPPRVAGDTRLERSPAWRCAPRYLTHSTIKVRAEDAMAARMLRLHDISVSGLFAETLHPWSPGERLTLALPVPSGELTVKAKVVHTISPEQARAGGHSPGMGLQFVELSPQQRAELTQFLGGQAPVSSLLNGAGLTPAPTITTIDNAAIRLFEGLEAGNYFSALGLPTGTPRDQVRERIAGLKCLFSTFSTQTTTAEGVRAVSALRALLRIDQLLDQQSAEHRTAQAEAPEQEHTQGLLQEAQQLLDSGAVHMARERANLAAKLSDDPAVRLGALQLLMRIAADDDAMHLARRIVTSDPDSFVGWWALFTLFEKKGHLTLAARAARQLLRLRPGDTKLLRRLAACQRRDG